MFGDLDFANAICLLKVLKCSEGLMAYLEQLKKYCSKLYKSKAKVRKGNLTLDNSIAPEGPAVIVADEFTYLGCLFHNSSACIYDRAMQVKNCFLEACSTMKIGHHVIFLVAVY